MANAPNTGPIPTAWPNTGTVAHPINVVGGGGGGGGAATIADGADVAEGSTTDPAVATDANGTVNSHIRGLVKILSQGLAVVGRNWNLTSAGDSVTAVISGTTAVSGTVTLGAGAAVVGQVEMTDGTTIASNVAGDAGQNSQVVSGARKEVSFTTTTVQVLATTDVSNYRGFSLQITSQGTSSSVQIQGSNDNVTWTNVVNVVGTSTGISNYTITGITTSGIFYGQLYYRFFRLNVTGISAGTTAGVVEFTAVPVQMVGVQGVSQVGQFTVQQGNSPGTTPWRVAQFTPGTPQAVSSAVVANTATSATLASTAGTTASITGFEVTAGGATVGSLVTVTVTGTINGTLNYVFAVPTGITAGATMLVDFPQPIPASAVNTPIVVNLPALGAGSTAAAVVAHGYNI